MRIVITGSGGFAGSHLQNWFTGQGHDVTGLTRADGDLRNLASLRDKLRALQPEYIIHLASNTHSGRDVSDTQEHIEANIHTTANVCLAAPASLKLLVLFGSIEEYGANQAPFREEMIPSVISVYGWSKIASRSLTEFLCRERSIPHTWVRPSLFFGPRLPERLFFGHVLHKCLRDEDVQLTWCEQTRDFLYIDDLPPMINCLLAHAEKARGEIWNLSSGKPRRLRDVAELIQKTVGRGRLQFGTLPYRSDEVMNFFSDPTRFRKTFSPPPLTPFKLAVEECVRRSSYENKDALGGHADMSAPSGGSFLPPLELSLVHRAKLQ